MSIRSALLLLSCFLLAVPASGVAPGANAACAEPFVDPVMGPVCAVPGGFVSILADGTRVFTHGPDPVPRAGAGGALADVGVSCVPEEEPHIRLIYALPADASVVTQATGFASKRDSIIAGVLQANAVVHANAAKFGTGMRWKMLCDETGQPAIDSVRLGLRTTQMNFWDAANDLVAKGYTGANEKILVFYDGTWNGCGGCGGWSYIPDGDQWGPSNGNNYGWGSISMIFIGNYGSLPIYALDRIILHEQTHAMGGVQMSAPHSSGQWHCNDGWDIMCLPDGGSTSAYTTDCFPVGFIFAAVIQPFDCGNDDYFHPDPAPGSYLATHWNVGASYNRFMDRVPLADGFG